MKHGGKETKNSESRQIPREEKVARKLGLCSRGAQRRQEKKSAFCAKKGWSVSPNTGKKRGECKSGTPNAKLQDSCQWGGEKDR